MRHVAAICALVFAAVCAAGSQALAHEGHDHKILGTVTTATAERVTLKDVDGKDVTVLVTKDTKVKAKLLLKVQEIKPGTRVVITAREGKDKTMVARTIEVGASSTTKPAGAPKRE
jgi:hypothetical protein